MSILNRYQAVLNQWGLSRIPFTPVAPEDPKVLAQIFHGREREIEQILPALYEGRNVMIRGAWGIGKTALIYKALDQLGAEINDLDQQLLIIYIGGIPELTTQGFYRTLLAAVARQLAAQDDVAKAISEKLTGLYPQTARTTLEGKVNLVFVTFGGKQDSVDHPIKADSIGDPYQLLIDLLDRAEALYSGLVVAVDDLDKQDVSILQGILEGSLNLFRMGQRRAFLLTGRGFTELQNATLRALGIFAEDLALPPMSPDDLCQIAIKYLNLVREISRDDAAPFSDDVMQQIAEYAQGSPRQLNHIGYKIMRLAADRQASVIDQECFRQVWPQLQRDTMVNVTPHLRKLLYLAYQANGISEDITNTQLDQVGALTFVQLLPELRLLEERELLIRTEDSQGFRFVPSKLVLPPDADSDR